MGRALRSPERRQPQRSPRGAAINPFSLIAGRAKGSGGLIRSNFDLFLIYFFLVYFYFLQLPSQPAPSSLAAASPRHPLGATTARDGAAWMKGARANLLSAVPTCGDFHNSSCQEEAGAVLSHLYLPLYSAQPLRGDAGTDRCAPSPPAPHHRGWRAAWDTAAKMGWKG